MPVFNDSNNVPELLPAGDYIWCCTDFECGLSKGKATSGSDMYEASIEIEPSGKVVHENLIDHKSSAWKIDTFLKSAGVGIKKGESFEFRADRAKPGVPWVNPIGLRGWCRVVVENYEKNGEKRQSNKIGTFYVDREKLPRRVIAEEEKPF